MGDFARAAGFTLRPDVEGGYVNHPDDPGGETYMGISRRSHPEAWEQGRPSETDVLSIYHRDYWLPIQGHKLPDRLAVALFDYSVHSGPSRAVKALQRLLGFEGGEVDGVLGPITLGRIEVSDADALVEGLMEERGRFLRSLPTFRTFGRGWMSRLDKLQAALGDIQGQEDTPVEKAEKAPEAPIRTPEKPDSGEGAPPKPTPETVRT